MTKRESSCRLLLVLALSTGFSVPAVAIEVGILHFPPLSIVHHDGPPTGSFVLLMGQIFQQAEIDYNFVGLPAKRLQHQLATGKIDIYLGVKGGSILQDKVIYGEQVLGVIELRAYTFHDGKLPTTFEDFFQKRIGLIRGFSYGGWADKYTVPENMTYVSILNTHKNALAMLQKKRIYYLLDYQQPIDVMLAETARPGLRYSTISSLEQIFIVSKNLPNASGVLQQLEHAYRQIKMPIGATQ